MNAYERNLVTFNGSIRNVKGGIFWIRTIKCVAFCRRHLLGIAIDINEFGANMKNCPQNDADKPIWHDK